MKSLTLKELNEINSRIPDNSNIRSNYRYDVTTKTWVFHGYSCCKCERHFKNLGVLTKHKEKCPASQGRKDDIEGKILTVDRHEWKPIDINQNQS